MKCKSQFDSHLTNNILHKKWNVISSQVEDIIVTTDFFKLCDNKEFLL